MNDEQQMKIDLARVTCQLTLAHLRGSEDDLATTINHAVEDGLSQQLIGGELARQLIVLQHAHQTGKDLQPAELITALSARMSQLVCAAQGGHEAGEAALIEQMKMLVSNPPV